MKKFQDIHEEPLLRLRNHVSLKWLAGLLRKEKRLTGESAGKLATFLESLDDEGLGAYVNFLNMREDLKFECKEYAEIFNDLAADFGDKNDLE